MPGSQISKLVSTINQHSGTAEQWSRISIPLRNLLEFPDEHPTPLYYVLKRVETPEWKAFLAGLYQHQGWASETTNAIRNLGLKEPWTPLPKIRRSATGPDPSFAKYNVVIPKGELQWK